MSQAVSYGHTNAVVLRPSLHDSNPTRVLVMDDDDGLRVVLGMSITYMGYEVECVGDGVAAIAAYESARTSGKPFGVVLFDLQIKGGMGGQETLAYLLDINPQIKAILYSAADQNPVMEHYDAYGFVARLVKPFSLSDLQALLQRVICASS